MCDTTMLIHFSIAQKIMQYNKIRKKPLVNSDKNIYFFGRWYCIYKRIMIKYSLISECRTDNGAFSDYR